VRCAIPRHDIQAAPGILNSWKEIAGYLGRGVRTVQRWERELQLPVHRIGKGKRSPVYAKAHELKFWLNTSGVEQLGAEGNHAKRPASPLGAPATKPVEESRNLLMTTENLARQIAELSVRQRRQAEVLQARIQQLRAKFK
jgi:hypothetical protein